MEQKTIQCPICEREVDFSFTNKHHVVPRSRKGKETIRICRDCHRQIHAFFTNKQLEKNLNTIELIRQDEKIKKYISWISKRSANSKVATKMSNNRKKSGSKYS